MTTRFLPACVRGVGCVLALVASAATARASLQFNIIGATDPVNNTATITLTYTSISDILATLTVEAENTSNFDARITGLALNNPIAGLTGATLGSATGTQDDSDWDVEFDPNGISTPQSFGSFDLGLLTGNNLEGGSPNSGIAVGDTGEFVINLSGTGLDDLTNAAFESAFFAALSEPKNAQDGQANFIARFQRTGDDGEGSDVGIWDEEPPVDPQEVVPETTSLIVWGVLAAACGVRARRRFV